MRAAHDGWYLSLRPSWFSTSSMSYGLYPVCERPSLSDHGSHSRRLIDLNIYIHPVPRNALNKTKAGFFAFQTFLYLISFLVAGLDIFIIVRIGPWSWEIRNRLNSVVYWSLVGIFACLVLFVFGAVGTGGWTIAFIMQSVCLLL